MNNSNNDGDNNDNNGDNDDDVVDDGDDDVDVGDVDDGDDDDHDDGGNGDSDDDDGDDDDGDNDDDDDDDDGGDDDDDMYIRQNGSHDGNSKNITDSNDQSDIDNIHLNKRKYNHTHRGVHGGVGSRRRGGSIAMYERRGFAPRKSNVEDSSFSWCPAR